MKRAFAFFLLLVLSIAAGPSAYAQAPAMADNEADRIEAAGKLLDLYGYERQLDFIFEKLSPVFSQGVIGALQGDPAAKAMVDELIANGKGGQGRFVAILSEEFFAAIKAQYPQIRASAAKEYAAAFTREELEAITAFYQTPAGAKSLRILPELQNKLGKAGQEYGRIAGKQAGQKGFERAINEMLPQSGKSKL